MAEIFQHLLDAVPPSSVMWRLMRNYRIHELKDGSEGCCSLF